MRVPLACLISAGALAVSAAIGPAVGLAAGAQSYYLDCASGSDAASGRSSERAWRTVERASLHAFRPGDRLLIRRGTTCLGTLAPQGSGTTAAPIQVNAYGSGSRPEIDGTGNRAAVYLHNVEGWELRNLAVTNRGDSTSADQRRNGIWVVLEDYGYGKHYVVADSVVRDVTGCACHRPDPTGGIVFSVIGSAVPTGFNDIRIRDNRVVRADGTAIGTTSTWERRPELPDGLGTQFVPIRNLVIDHNEIVDAGSDGITVESAVGAHVHHNRVDGFSHHAPDFRSGIWTWNSDRALVEFNEITRGAGNPQGVSLDIDAGNVGTVFQYNLSHDNGGLFLLICNNFGSALRDSVARYNISENDHTPFDFFGVFAIGCGPAENTHVYNNTVYSPEAHTLVRNVAGVGEIKFTNNILVGQPTIGSAIDGEFDSFDHNLYHRVSNPPDDAGGVSADPLLVAPGTATGLNSARGYRLRSGSPALAAGTPIPGSPARDYYGNRVGATPHIGAYQGPAR